MRYLALALVALVLVGAQLPAAPGQFSLLVDPFGTWVILVGVAHTLDRRIGSVHTRVSVLESAGKGAGGGEEKAEAP